MRWRQVKAPMELLYGWQQVKDPLVRVKWRGDRAYRSRDKMRAVENYGDPWEPGAVLPFEGSDGKTARSLDRS